jgi:hypothetical protein
MDRKNLYGQIILVCPGCHLTILGQGNRILYESEFKLTSNLLHGPVDYGTGGQHSIPLPERKILATKVALHDIGTQDTKQIVPLR